MRIPSYWGDAQGSSPCVLDCQVRGPRFKLRLGQKFVLSPVGLKLSSQTHCPSPSPLSCLHPHDWCSSLASQILFAWGIKSCCWLHAHAQQGQSPKYLCDLMRKPLSALSSRRLRSADRLDLLIPRTRTQTALAQHHAFAIVSLSLWNLSPAIPSNISILMPPISCYLKTFLYVLGAATFW